MNSPEDTGADRDDGYKVGPGCPPREHQFKPGNPGRPKGARSILQEQFFKALQRDFEENGEAVLEIMRAEKPNEYARMIASLMSKELTGEDGKPLFPEEVVWRRASPGN